MPKIEKPQDNTKKNIKLYKEQDPEKVKLYLQQICNIPKEKIVYVDETGIDTYLCGEYCYAKRGEKVITLLLLFFYCFILNLLYLINEQVLIGYLTKGLTGIPLAEQAIL